jgi:hypothetical protein
MKSNTKPRSARKALALPFDGLPLFRWADTHEFQPPLGAAPPYVVDLLMRRFGLREALSRESLRKT